MMILIGEHLTKLNIFLIKIHSKLKVERNLLNLIKNIYENPSANIIVANANKGSPYTHINKANVLGLGSPFHLVAPLSPLQASAGSSAFRQLPHR